MIETVNNNIELQDFLADFSERTEISFDIEESKKNELLEVAKNRGIILKDSRDLAIFSGTYEVLDTPNGNGKIVKLNQETLRKLPTLIGKSINIGHIRRYCVGFICDFRYIEKEKKIKIFGIFWKQIFADEWERFTKLFKDKKIGLSSEIWSPKAKRVYFADGTYELKDIEFSGVAIIFINGKDEPAEPDCLVLESSKKYCEDNQDLIYSNLNKDSIKEYNCDESNYCENLIISGQETIAPIQQAPVFQTPNKIKIICANCSHNFEYLFVPNTSSSIKCPNCLSIVDQNGKMLYPAQVQNFKLSCPNCSATNWLILSSDEKGAKVKCQSCMKEYSLSFKEMPKDLKEMLDKVQFLNMGSRPCWQCGTYNDYIVPSHQEKINLHCKKCGLDYFFNVSYQVKKDIKSIEEIGIKKVENNKEVVEMEKSAVRKLLRKAVSKMMIAKKQASDLRKLGVPRTDAERAQSHFGISVEDWKKLDKVKQDEYITKLPKRGSGLSKSILRKAATKIKDSRQSLDKKIGEVVVINSKLEKFGAGIKKLGGKISELSITVKDKDLEISALKKELAKKIETPVTSVQEPEVVLETASLNVGLENPINGDRRTERIAKIRKQSSDYLNPKEIRV